MMGEVVVLMGVLRGGDAGFDRDVGLGWYGWWRWGGSGGSDKGGSSGRSGGWQ